jgi:hypothetical protein
MKVIRSYRFELYFWLSGMDLNIRIYGSLRGLFGDISEAVLAETLVRNRWILAKCSLSFQAVALFSAQYL